MGIFFLKHKLISTKSQRKNGSKRLLEAGKQMGKPEKAEGGIGCALEEASSKQTELEALSAAPGRLKSRVRGKEKRRPMSWCGVAWDLL